MISDEEREQVREATDIVQLVGETVMLRPRGGEFWGCCPFHHEKSPSFHVNPSTGLWNCFGCHQGGDVFAYVMKRENLEFPDAIRFLAERAGIELHEERGASRGPRRSRLVEANEEAQRFFSTMLLRGRGEGPAAARAYLSKRGFGSDVCRKWRLGFAPGHGSLVAHLRERGFSGQEIVSADLALDRGGRLADRFFDRVMFPIHDEQGHCIAFGGRVLTDAKPKYLNTRDTNVFHKSKHMFAFDYAKEAIVAKGQAIVVEGYTDVIALHEAGYENVVATLGTALTEEHVRTLARFAKKIVCMFDGDAAGQKAADAAIQYLDRTEADLRCVVLPDNLDPAEFVGQRGAAALQPYLDSAQPLIDFVFEKRLSGYDLSVPGRKVAALDDMARLLSPLRNSILLDGYATRLADALGIDVDQTKRRIRSAAPARRGRVPEPDGPLVREAPSPEEPPLAETPLLTSEDRQQAAAERSLLGFMAAFPDVLRAESERVASLSWTDPRHEAIAWAILATPAGTSPSGAVQAAVAVCPEAPTILSGGSIPFSDDLTREERGAFLLDDVELASTRRRIRAMRARLSSAVGEDSKRLFQEATDLQKHANDLTRRLSGMAKVDKNG